MESIASTAAINGGERGSATGGLEQALGRDDFMRLLVAKLENQNPLEPAKDTEFIAELATFSSLEQLINVNENIERLAANQDQLINAQTLTLIGKEALVEAGDEIRVKNGVPDGLVYALPRQARSAQLLLIGPDGQVARTYDLQTTPNGRVTLDWNNPSAITGEGSAGDGKEPPVRSADEPLADLADGNYRIQLNVIDANGDPMSIATYRSLPIEGVIFFDGGVSLVSGDREVPFDQILEIREGRN